MRLPPELAVGARVLRSPAPDRRRVIEAVAELTRASIEIRVLPSSRTVGLLGVSGVAERSPAIEPERLREAALIGRTAALVANRLPWHPTCLRQALAVQRMLRRRNIPSQIHLGVSNPRDLAAHAWVTVGGQPVVGGAGVERFVPLAAFD